MDGKMQERSRFGVGGEIKTSVLDKFERPNEMHKQAVGHMTRGQGSDQD